MVTSCGNSQLPRDPANFEPSPWLDQTMRRMQEQAKSEKHNLCCPKSLSQQNLTKKEGERAFIIFHPKSKSPKQRLAFLAKEVRSESQAANFSRSSVKLGSCPGSSAAHLARKACRGDGHDDSGDDIRLQKPDVVFPLVNDATTLNWIKVWKYVQKIITASKSLNQRALSRPSSTQHSSPPLRSQAPFDIPRGLAATTQRIEPPTCTRRGQNICPTQLELEILALHVFENATPQVCLSRHTFLNTLSLHVLTSHGYLYFPSDFLLLNLPCALMVVWSCPGLVTVTTRIITI